MDHRGALRRGVLCLPFFMAAFACDGTEATPPTDSTHSQVLANTPNQGGAGVQVVANRAPQVLSMQSSQGRATPGAPVTLQVVAGDPDGDALAFVWKSSCPGDFDRTDLALVVFTAGDPGSAISCVFDVDVSDGHGGHAQGTLVLTAVAARLNVAPQMGIAYQSTDEADPGDVVILHASATDPEGEALSWTWKAAQGAFSHQVDEAGSSDVRWTVPNAPGATDKIVAVATDPEGAQASFVFTVSVLDP